jgi:hypothetical protein
VPQSNAGEQPSRCGVRADGVSIASAAQLTGHRRSAFGLWVVVTAMDTSNVDTVFIAGKAVKRAGALMGVDLDSVRRQAQASRDYLIDKLGWPRSVIDTSLSGH